MKRSEINRIIEEVKEFCRQRQFPLPPFAYWTPEDWKTKGTEYDEIRDNRLGWDITDYGSGRFAEIGLALFTLRNGNALNPEKYPKPYCEKLLVVGENQVTPDHHHRSKTEDIINRGGGNLLVQVWEATRDGQILDTPVVVSLDGRLVSVDAATVLRLQPGESITLTPYVHHRFWGEPGHGMVLCIEVSSVNDDERDNVFIPPVPRFSQIDEDEEPIHLLCNEYPPAP